MIAAKPLGNLLATLLDRRPFLSRPDSALDIEMACRQLLDERDETAGIHLASSILARYLALDPGQLLAFFGFLNDDLDIDAARIASLAGTYRDDPATASYAELRRAAEPVRQRLFRRLNEAPGATSAIVRMRQDLLRLLPEHPGLARTDHDLRHLLGSWFNRGFLVLQRITWDSPASILEKIIAYEGVHEIDTWDDLRRRLHPGDRRCFAFFHPSVPSEPLIFVEVALTRGIPGSVQALLSDRRDAIPETEADTAVFYSISNCQPGLAGVSFGNSLIKQVARDLARDLPNLRTFVTLSPIPGLVAWLASEGIRADSSDTSHLLRMAASYLLEAKDVRGRPKDPVARFHLGNGAQVHALHAGADLSAKGLAASSGVMVNYLYDLGRISQNAAHFAEGGVVAASPAVRALARKA